MKCKIIILVLLLNVVACSAKLTEKGFIAQGTAVVPYSTEQWQMWQQQYTSYKLSAISITIKEIGNEVVKLNGIYFDQPDSNELIYFLQGNGMTVENSMKSVMPSLAKLDKDLVIFDRRGSGASNGTADISNLIADANRQYDYIAQQLSPDKIIIHGFSLGSFIAGQVAKDKEPHALVLQGSATNVDEWIDTRMPWYSKLFVTIEVEPAFYQVDNKLVVEESYKNPLLIIAGEKDLQAPAVLSRRLFAASQSKLKQLMVVDDAGHGNMLNKSQEISQYRKFLASL